MNMKGLILVMVMMMVSISLFAAGSSLDEIVGKIKNGELSLTAALESGQISFDEALENGLVNEELKTLAAGGMMEMGNSGDELSGYKEMPEFTAKTLDGKEITQDYFKQNKLTMINLWGTYCSPCIGEMKLLNKLNETYKDKGFAILGVVTDGEDSEDLANMILERKGVKFDNIAMNSELENSIFKNVLGVPFSFFVDSEGNIVGQQVLGAIGEKAYENIIKEELNAIG